MWLPCPEGVLDHWILNSPVSFYSFWNPHSESLRLKAYCLHLFIFLAVTFLFPLQSNLKHVYFTYCLIFFYLFHSLLRILIDVLFFTLPLAEIANHIYANHILKLNGCCLAFMLNDFFLSQQ